MITQTDNPHRFISKSRQIAAQIPGILFQWGLVPKFKHWRLMEDSETGMVVLFGLLDYQNIVNHTTTVFTDYFDPRLLHILATELNVQVISSSNDGLRYTFILEKSQPGFSQEIGDDHTIMREGLSDFWEITGATNEPKNLANQALPDVLFMNEAEFSQQMTEYEADLCTDKMSWQGIGFSGD